jgi:hypothetical protein
MRTGFTPWSDLILEHALPYQRAACFVLASLEREHRLNLDAWMAHWLQAPLAWWPPLPARRPHAGTCAQAAPPRSPSRHTIR